MSGAKRPARMFKLFHVRSLIISIEGLTLGLQSNRDSHYFSIEFSWYGWIADSQISALSVLSLGKLVLFWRLSVASED